jgi:hypothetical protein
MKRSQLIEYGIITIGLIFGFKFIDNLFGGLVALISSSGMGFDLGAALVPFLSYLFLYGAALFLLVQRSGQIATFLSKNYSNEPIPIKIDKHSLLQVILIGICMATIIPYISYLGHYFYQSFKNGAGARTSYEAIYADKQKFTVIAIQTIIAGLILYFSKDISGWFVRKKEVDIFILDSENDNESNV